MDTKVLMQDLANGVSSRSGLPKKDADTFVRCFFGIIEQYLLEEKIVKVKGLGTFKVVEVSGRDSVNVNTGERFHIKGHSKITFTPDPVLRDHVNRPFADFQTVILNDNVDMKVMEYVDVPDDPTVRDDEEFITLSDGPSVEEPTSRPTEPQEPTSRPAELEEPISHLVEPEEPTFRPEESKEPTFRPEESEEPTFRPAEAGEPIFRPADVAEPTSHLADTIDSVGNQTSTTTPPYSQDEVSPIDSSAAQTVEEDQVTMSTERVPEIPERPIASDNKVEEVAAEENEPLPSMSAQEMVEMFVPSVSLQPSSQVADNESDSSKHVEQEIKSEVDDELPESSVTEDTSEKAKPAIAPIESSKFVAGSDHQSDGTTDEVISVFEETEPEEKQTDATVLEILDTESDEGRGENDDEQLPARRQVQRRTTGRPKYVISHSAHKNGDSHRDKGTSHFWRWFIGILVVVLLMGASYFAGTSHMFDNGCTSPAVTETPEQKVVTPVADPSTPEDTTDLDKPFNYNEEGETELGSNDEMEEDALSKTHEDEMPEVNTADNKREDNANTAQNKQNSQSQTTKDQVAQNQKNQNNQDKADKTSSPTSSAAANYPQVAGGAYQIVDVLQSHVVRSGDNLSAIARKYLGHPDFSIYIIRLNNINNPNLIEPGQSLKIPKLVLKR